MQERRTPWERLLGLDPRLWDAVVVGLMLALTISIYVLSDMGDGRAGVRAADAIGAALLVAACLALYGRRRAPLAVSVTVSSLILVYAAAHGTGAGGSSATATPPRARPCWSSDRGSPGSCSSWGSGCGRSPTSSATGRSFRRSWPTRPETRPRREGRRDGRRRDRVLARGRRGRVRDRDPVAARKRRHAARLGRPAPGLVRPAPVARCPVGGGRRRRRRGPPTPGRGDRRIADRDHGRRGPAGETWSRRSRASCRRTPRTRSRAPYGISLPGMLKHVRILEDAELVTTRKQGRTREVALAAAQLDDASRWIELHRVRWERRLDRLEALVERRQREAREGGGGRTVEPPPDVPDRTPRREGEGR